MVYRLCNTKDLQLLPHTDSATNELLYHYTQVLAKEYGEERDIDSDGGYVLYLTPDGSFEEIEAYFDYKSNVVEYVDRFGGNCAVTYLLNNEYCITIVASAVSLPEHLLKEIDTD